MNRCESASFVTFASMRASLRSAAGSRPSCGRAAASPENLGCSVIAGSQKVLGIESYREDSFRGVDISYPSAHALCLNEQKTLQFESEPGFDLDRRVNGKCRPVLFFDPLAIHMVRGYLNA
jgi:hypothetical protein